MKLIIVANWKENPTTQKEAVSLFEVIKKGVRSVKNIEVAICPPFVYLPLLKGLTLGAQNVFFKEKGAFTGEVSPLMLKDLKVKYVIVGHSEARRYLNETDQIINKKIRECLHEKLKPIFCIGEDEGEDKFKTLKKQISEGLKNIPEKELKNILIAYEPVWAIGTGKNCSIEETINSVLFIKKTINELYNKKIADGLTILYGGSVNSDNSSLYIKEACVNGLLVGGVSLDAQEFIKIIKSAP